MNFYTEPVCAASKQGRLPIAWHAVVKMCWWFQSWLICSVDPTRVNKCPSRISLNQVCTETVHCCKQEQLPTGEGPLSKRAISTVLTSQVHPLPPHKGLQGLGLVLFSYLNIHCQTVYVGSYCTLFCKTKRKHGGQLRNAAPAQFPCEPRLCHPHS